MRWQEKVHKVIARAATDAYNKANRNKNGSLKKKHVPYTLPVWVDDLVSCLNKDDEEEAKRIMLYDFLRDY